MKEGILQATSFSAWPYSTYSTLATYAECYIKKKKQNQESTI